ncbi:hypothetical protein CNMCM6106_002875 [Aspergillus hiratsukae]|uniref:Calcineurin-like phosphoesterase domain-containing protein n=1 Tax=Aspergillus hiratsukae TaxID=1194566 RepID=A0A8H6Q7L0_9EURO|nr:hypothetical protein CNMCM6106_002875 [Aspergillus hiratsukae]
MATFKKMTLALASVAPTVLATSAPSKMTVGVIGDYGWTGWNPAPLSFCNEVMPKLIAQNITIPREVQNDCDAGDPETASYVGQVCAMKGCSAFISVGDNFYDSGVDFTTGGIPRFQEAWVDMYQGGGQSGVDFETKIAPLYDSRWYFGTEGLPYYTYDLTGSDWTATFVVVDSDCFLDSYQESTSVYQNPYTAACHEDTATQVAFLEQAFEASKADWKFLQLHHPYMSATANQTDLAPLIAVVEKYGGIVLNGHDHCLAHFYNNNTNFILSGAAGYPQVGDCNYGVAPGPYAQWLGANTQAAANGFVTMDITKQEINVEYYARNMQFEGGDLYPVENELEPSYSFQIKAHP